MMLDWIFSYCVASRLMINKSHVLLLTLQPTNCRPTAKEKIKIFFGRNLSRSSLYDTMSLWRLPSLIHFVVGRTSLFWPICTHRRHIDVHNKKLTKQQKEDEEKKGKKEYRKEPDHSMTIGQGY